MDYSLKKELFRAIKKGRINDVKELINAGVNINATNRYGDTPLLLAISEFHEDIAQILINHGADVNIPDPYGNTALTEASMYGYTDIVCLLLDAGADTNSHDADGNTPLMNAVGHGHKDIICLLLNVGVFTDDLNRSLIIASEKEYKDILTCERLCPVTQSLANGYISQILIDAYPNIDGIDQDGDTALTLVSDRGYKNTVKLLLDAGANINSTNVSGDTPLACASLNGHIDVVKILLDRGADPKISDLYGNTALTGAAMYGHKDIIQLLLASGSDINEIDADGYTALMYAVKKEYKDIIYLLFDVGLYSFPHGQQGIGEANIATRITVPHLSSSMTINSDSLDYSLAIAATKGYKDIFQTLLVAGSNINAIDDNGFSALDYAKIHNQKMIIEYVENLLNDNPDTKDSFTGITHLMQASIDGKIDLLQVYAQQNLLTNINTQDANGNTALIHAVINNHINVVKFLLRCDASPLIINKDGHTVLEYTQNHDMIILLQSIIRKLRAKEICLHKENIYNYYPGVRKPETSGWKIEEKLPITPAYQQNINDLCLDVNKSLLSLYLVAFDLGIPEDRLSKLNELQLCQEIIRHMSLLSQQRY